MSNIELILDNLKNLTLLEINKLIIEIEKNFDIKFSSNTINSLVPVSINDLNVTEIKEEKLFYTITLLSVPQDKKISLLKIVRNITGFGLKESKEIIDNVPKIIKENLSKEECEKIKNEIELVGGSVNIE